MDPDTPGITIVAEATTPRINKITIFTGVTAITIVNDGSEENRKKIGEVLSASASDNLLQRNRLCTYESGIEIYVELKPHRSADRRCQGKPPSFLRKRRE